MLEDILGSSQDDPTKIMTRLLLTRLQFSRVIGKGGQTVNHIRSSTGVNVRGCDLDDDNRLVLISGTLPQVLRGFDMIIDLIFPNMVNGAANGFSSPHIANNMPLGSMASAEVAVVCILLEHSKVTIR